MKGLFSIIALFVVAYIAYAVYSASSITSSINHSPTNPSDGSHQVSAASAEACKSGMNAYSKAVDKYNANEYQAAADIAANGLTHVDDCQAPFLYPTKGLLLYVKAAAEHHTPSGDSRTDLNQAITLLEECQTQPDFYGQSIGATCATRQQDAIQMQVNWQTGN